MEYQSPQTAPQFHPPPVSELLLGGIDNSPSKNSEQIEIPLSIDSDTGGGWNRGAV